MPKNLARVAAVAAIYCLADVAAFTVRIAIRLDRAIAAALCLALVVSAPAFAVTVPLNFAGNAQTFNAGLSSNGSLEIGGTALFLTIPNQTIPLSIKGTPTVTSNPVSSVGTTTGDLTGPGTTTLTDLTDLDLDLLNGQTTNFAINTLNITALPFNVTLDVSGTLSGLTFTQTDGAVLTGGPGTGTFVDNGDLTATLSNLKAVLGAFGSPLQTLTIDPQSLTNPFALAGTWKVTALGLGQRKVELDGGATLNVPLSLVTSLVSTASTVNLNVALLSSVGIAFSFHLETITVPEPGSVALLGLGLFALIPLIRNRRKT